MTEGMSQWADRYRITSISGRIYTRRMVYKRCLLVCGAGNGPGIRELLDDDSFMRPRRGIVPSAVAHDVFSELAARGKLIIETFDQHKARKARD